MEDDLEFLTVNDFAKRMSVTKEQIYMWLKSGRLHGIRLEDGPKSPWRIPKTELYRFREQAYLRKESP